MVSAAGRRGGDGKKQLVVGSRCRWWKCLKTMCWMQRLVEWKARTRGTLCLSFFIFLNCNEYKHRLFNISSVLGISLANLLRITYNAHASKESDISCGKRNFLFYIPSDLLPGQVQHPLLLSEALPSLKKN